MKDPVTVERALLEDLLALVEKVYSKNISPNNKSHRDYLRKRISVLRALLDVDLGENC